MLPEAAGHMQTLRQSVNGSFWTCRPNRCQLSRACRDAGPCSLVVSDKAVFLDIHLPIYLSLRDHYDFNQRLQLGFAFASLTHTAVVSTIRPTCSFVKQHEKSQVRCIICLSRGALVYTISRTSDIFFELLCQNNNASKSRTI